MSSRLHGVVIEMFRDRPAFASRSTQAPHLAGMALADLAHEHRVAAKAVEQQPSQSLRGDGQFVEWIAATAEISAAAERLLEYADSNRHGGPPADLGQGTLLVDLVEQYALEQAEHVRQTDTSSADLVGSWCRREGPV